jgi:hypothetical protein
MSPRQCAQAMTRRKGETTVPTLSPTGHVNVALPAKKVRSPVSSEVILPVAVGDAAHALTAVTIGYGD